MEKLKFPLDFTQCPVCGSTRRIANEVLEVEREKGRAPEGVITCLFMQQSIIANPTGRWLSAPRITTYYDVCAEPGCGTVYCIHAELDTIVQGAAPKLPPGGLFSKS